MRLQLAYVLLFADVAFGFESEDLGSFSCSHCQGL